MVNTRLGEVIAFAVLVAAQPGSSAAQGSQSRFETGIQLTSVASSQFDSADVGLGGRIAWYPSTVVGIEAELNVYPGDFPADQPPPFSRARVEGLFGVTMGPRFARLRPFVSLRPGFLTLRDAPQPFPCIRIFPPPLACALASGLTVFALDIGGGVQVPATRRTFIRVDVGDRLLRYPGPVFDADRTLRQNPFFDHDLRFAAGGGLRF